MDSSFVSFHFKPEHPIVGSVKQIIASHGIVTATGEDLGGGRLFPEIQQRIRRVDALVAVLTPDNRVDTHFEPARWVEAEVQEARSLGKPTIALVHADTRPTPVFQDHEYIPFDDGNLLAAVIKLSNTLYLWRAAAGRTVRVRIVADDSSAIDDERIQCHYQIRNGVERGPWQEAQLFPEPGGLFVYIPNVRADSFFRVRLTTAAGILQSPFSPQDVALQVERHAGS